MAEKTVTKEKLFFPNLDGFRFLCFFAVFLFHCDGLFFRKIGEHHQRTQHILHFLFQNGEVGVNAFFVLSGFLITFLLIKEKKLNNDINLKNFYIRRVLRIWPLFYTCVFLGFVAFPLVKFHTFPSPDEIANYHYYLFFICNFDTIRLWPLLPDALVLAVLWSVAVEEQFYLVWPITLKFANTKIYPVIFSVIILFTLVFRSFYTNDTDKDFAYRNFDTFSVIGDMALGGMMAYYCSYQSKLFNYIRDMRRWQIGLIYVLTIVVILFKKIIFALPVFMVTERLVLAILFALIIAEQNFSANSLFKFSTYKNISKLGTYTYGLYCLHSVAISAIVFVMQKKGWESGTLLSASIATVVALLISIAISLLSYHLFEKHFLKLKNKFAFITKH